MLTCKLCDDRLPFGQTMVAVRANIGKAGELHERATSHFEACLCTRCAEPFVRLTSVYDCSGCGGPIIDGEEVIILSLHTGTLICDDLKFTEDLIEEIYRVHSVCNDPAATAKLLPWLN